MTTPNQPPSTQNGWRPIETAPKAGQIILRMLGPTDAHQGFVAIGYRNSGHWAGCSLSQPTHWQPLPSPDLGGDEQMPLRNNDPLTAAPNGQPAGAATVGQEAKEPIGGLLWDAVRQIQDLVGGRETETEGAGSAEDMQEAYDHNEFVVRESEKIQAIIEAYAASATANLRRELEEAKRWNGVAVAQLIQFGKDLYDRDSMRLEVATLRRLLGRLAIRADVLAQFVRDPNTLLNSDPSEVLAHLSELLVVTNNTLARTTTRPDLVAVGRGELEELRKDKERLDWLTDSPGSAYAAVDADGDRLMHFVAVPEKPSSSRRGFIGKSPREAIDSAATAKGRAL